MYACMCPRLAASTQYFLPNVNWEGIGREKRMRRMGWAAVAGISAHIVLVCVGGRTGRYFGSNAARSRVEFK